MEGKTVSSATIIVTQRNIRDREAKILHLRKVLRKAAKTDSRRPQLEEKLTELLTEVAALRASLHYYKDTAALSADIDLQRKKVRALTALFKKSKGKKQHKVGVQLRSAAKTLNEMLAAAKAQQVQTGVHAPLPPPPPGPPSLHVVPNPAKENPAEGDSSAEALEEAVEQADAELAPEGFQPSEFSLEAIPDAAEGVIATLEESWDKLDEYTDEEGEVWYKNPIVLLAAGTATFLVLRRTLRS